MSSTHTIAAAVGVIVTLCSSYTLYQNYIPKLIPAETKTFSDVAKIINIAISACALLKLTTNSLPNTPLKNKMINWLPSSMTLLSVGGTIAICNVIYQNPTSFTLTNDHPIFVFFNENPYKIVTSLSAVCFYSLSRKESVINEDTTIIENGLTWQRKSGWFMNSQLSQPQRWVKEGYLAPGVGIY